MQRPQIDLLQSLPASIPLLIPATTIDEVRHRSLPISNRFQQLVADEERLIWVFWNESARESATSSAAPDQVVTGVESANDQNDRAIRQTVQYYTAHLASLAPPRGAKHPALVLLSDDKGNRQKAKEQGLHAVSVRDYVEGLADAGMREALGDLVARIAFERPEDDEDDALQSVDEQGQKRLYARVGRSPQDKRGHG